jgi:hypothetical protein
MMADTEVCVPRLLAERCDGAISSPPRWRCVSPEVGRRPDYCFDQSTGVPVGMPELALNNEQRHAFATHLYRVRVART